MFIRSQDKEKLINTCAATDFIYTKNIGSWYEGEPEGNYVCTTLTSGNTLMIASYETKEQCIAAIERIMFYLANPEFDNETLDMSSADFSLKTQTKSIYHEQIMKIVSVKVSV